MKKPGLSFGRPVRYLACLLGAALLVAYLCGAVLVRAAGDGAAGPAWAKPTAMALRRVSAINTIRHEPSFLSNLDCNLLTYRLTSGDSLETGCFTPTAYGLLDADNGVVIFNGTDEGVPLLPYWPSQVLVPWPQAPGLLAIDAASTGGSYISLYKNPLAVLHDQRNQALQLTAKQLTKPPDLALRDADGKQLVINPQTLAFSDNGSWLVAETLNGSFVRVNLATLDVMAFASAFGSLGSPALLQSQVAVSDDGRYVAIGNKEAVSLKVYDLADCDGVIDNLQPQNCASHDYWGFAQQRISGLQAVRHLRFVNQSLISFEAQTGDPASSGVYELAPQVNITALINYLGLGDSYTSGEGAFDYLTGTDTPNNMCHLSVHSYPLLLTRDLFGGSGGHSVACSGAGINDVGSSSQNYRGQVKGIASLEQLQQTQPMLLASIMADYTPGYVAQQRFVKQYQPAVTTVSIGGNDIGFGDILQKCVEPHVSLHPSDNTCFNSYEDRLEVIRLIDRTVPRWTALYKQLLAEAPDTQLYVVGYPQIVDSNGNCGLNVHLSKSELQFTEELTDYLNEAIHQAVAASGATYVDIGQALAGHRLCEAASHAVAVNGLTAGSDAGVLGLNIFGKESYHPNALGQALIEQAILQQTHNLTLATPIGSADASSQAILDAPKTGRAVNVLVPDDNLAAGLVQAGKSTPVQANGVRDGLKPAAVYSIRLDGPNGQVISAVVSTPDGDISTDIKLPDGTAAGGHTIDITGSNQAGEPVDVTQPIYVPASENDADGDGTPDSLDTCPGAANSGQDSDRNGIDDVCDTLIGLSQASGGQGGAGARQIAAVSSIGQIINNANGSRIAKLLGAATTDPAVIAGRPLKIAASQPKVFRRPLTKLYVINWLAWVALAVIVWLLVLLAIYARRCIKRSPDCLKIRDECVPKLAGFDYNKGMVWLRKGTVHLLSLLLLVSLVGMAFAVSANINLTHPKKLATWLDQSNFYSTVVTNALHDAQQSASNDVGAGRVSLSDPVVQQAAKSVFSPQVLKQYTDTFLNGNYAWLEGKTSMPKFTIDLTAAKQKLAQQVGQSVETRVAGLPVCSSAQLAQLQSTLDTDPLTIPCRLPSLNPQAAAAQATDQITGSSNFLNNPIITANALNPNGSNQRQPYYHKLSSAPKLYRLGLKLPWIYGGLAILSMLGITFIAPRKRKGIRRIGVVLLEAGIILVAVKFVADAVFNRLEKRVFSSSSIGQFQQSLTDFLHRLEAQLVKVDLWFGIVLLVLGLALLAALWFTRQKSSSAKAGSLKPLKPGTTISPGEQGAGDRPPLPVLKQPPRSKPPRLIQ